MAEDPRGDKSLEQSAGENGMNSIAEIFGRGASYKALLQTDEWKAFSRNVRQNYGGSCAVCKRSAPHVITHVHHLFYDASRMPWEYECDEVVLLCQSCHHEMHDRLKEFRKYVFGKLNPQTFRVLNGALAVGLVHNNPLELVHAIASMCSSPNSVKRFANDWTKGQTT